MKAQQQKIASMREGGAILGNILEELLHAAKPETSLIDLEKLAKKRIRQAGGSPSFMTVEGYNWATCLCVNDVIVHGIPTEKKLKPHDVITIDIGMLYKGFHTDTAWTKIVQSKQLCTHGDTDVFLETGQKALRRAITQAKAGNHIGHISRMIEETVEGAGYGVVKSLIGHGVGEELHMPPQIPGLLKGPIERTPKIVDGMSLAIEVIYTMGNPAVQYVHNDGWSIATTDGSLSAVFEQTVLIENGKPFEATPGHA